METREEILQKLYHLKEPIAAFVDARTRQADYANRLRKEALVQEEEYDTKTISHRFIQISFFIIIFSSLTILLVDLLALVIAGRGTIISDFVVTVVLVGILLFLLKQKVQGKKAGWIYPAIIFVEIAMLRVFVTILSNPIGLVFAGIGGFIAYKVSTKYFNSFIDFLGSDTRKRNEEYRKEYQEIIQTNNELRTLYDDEGQQMELYRSQALQYGNGWFPQDYYTLHAISYFIHSFENFKADTIKEAVQLYDTYLDREARRKFEVEMIALEEESLINQEKMIELQKYSNVLKAAQISATRSQTAAINRNTDAVYSNAKELQNINQKM